MGGGGGGVVRGVFGVGTCDSGLPTLTPFQTKIRNFRFPFSDLASKICMHFQTCKFLESTPISVI